MNRSDLSLRKRVVVKVGTSQLTNAQNHVDPDKMKAIVAQIARVRKSGREVLLVTSGAVGIGLGLTGRTAYPRAIAERQALAAMGQSRLMHMYETCFRPHNLCVGQVLLTAQDVHTRERYLNVRNTLLRLLEFGAIPVINENDTVSVSEIKFGDNDTLSANVALAAGADLLVLLTDTDGLFDKNPKLVKGAERIREVKKIDDRIAGLAKGSDKMTAIGGMETKITAARIATAAGVPVVIARGTDPDVLMDILSGADTGTFFHPSAHGLNQKERWIAHTRKKPGSLVVDRGCRAALLKGASILPVGVTAVKGDFDKGDSVRVLDDKGREIGTGLSNYSAREFKEVMGQKFKEEIIHSDNFVRNENYEDTP
ncbi:MAG: glutamate 5-kinase [Fibrobacterota bacterium]